jgi:hypothetical protein
LFLIVSQYPCRVKEKKRLQKNTLIKKYAVIQIGTVLQQIAYIIIAIVATFTDVTQLLFPKTNYPEKNHRLFLMKHIHNKLACPYFYTRCDKGLQKLMIIRPTKIPDAVAPGKSVDF